MGFIFLTLAIYQAEAARWGEGEGSNSQMPASAQQGNHWFMVSLPLPITLFLSCLLPSFPAVVCLLFLLSPSIVMHSIKLPSFCSYSLWMFPAPNSSPLFPLLPSSSFFSPSSFLLFFLNITLLFYLLYCITGLWGWRLVVHHEGDDNTHGQLQLPCLRLWRPLSDTCAAGEWSVLACFLF